MLGRSFSVRAARGPRRRGAGGKGHRSTCPSIEILSWNMTIVPVELRACGPTKKNLLSRTKNSFFANAATTYKAPFSVNLAIVI